MKKSYLIMAAAAALFAACSSNDDAVTAQQPSEQSADQEVGFSAYVNRGTTRSGLHGTLTTDQLKSDAFGVFAYYTDNVPYSQTSTPDFMYNQKVTFSDPNWVYTPLKYWPNEFGGTAISDGEDRLTFFAYAPYVTVIPGTGRIDQSVHGAADALTSGIVGMTSNVETGDPYIKYYVDLKPVNRVDLCWGVANTALGSGNTVTGATANSIAKGDPFIDVIKPKTGDKIDFDFKHALASLNVQIAADVDLATHDLTKPVDANTKIYVRSVTFEGFATKGLLNLNASATEGPLWYELSSTNTKIGSTSITVYDGRRDGKEGQANATASNETPKDLNTTIIQTNAAEEGVTNVLKNLFDNNTATTPVYVIPTGDNLKITIVYDVETSDSNLAGYLSDGTTKGSSVENKITKEISWSSGGSAAPAPMVAGKQYTVKLYLGMTSVKFDASVSDWATGASSDTDLPINAD